MRGWLQFSERQIKKAEREGQLKGLAGEGERLPDRPGDAFLDPGEAVGHRIMAEAGAVPEEITLKRDLDAARAAWKTATDPGEKKACMAKIADLELRHAIAREARMKFFGRPGS